jgi:transcriptional regulator with XRE-family HTH domain
MAFAQRLVGVRKQQGLTQQVLAERSGLHVTLVRRYESGKTQPGLDALRRIALALSISADLLLFDPEERGPSDDLRLQFEAASRLDPEERRILKELIEGILLKHEAKRWASSA